METTTANGVHRRIGIIVVIFVLVVGFAAVQRPISAAAAPATAQEQEVLRLINRDRAAAGLSPLASDAALAATSRTWSSTMARTLNFTHDLNLRNRVSAVEPRIAAWAENIGWNTSRSAQAIHNTFMASPRHRGNILTPGFNRAGVGIVISGGRMWLTVRFIAGPNLRCDSQPRTSVVAADLDGNGADDLAVNRAGTDCDRVLMGASSSLFSRQSAMINGSYTPIAGDFDGDGTDEVFWYAPGPTRDYLSRWARPNFNGIPQTVNGHYRPYSGDYDGDGRDDIMWYSPGPAGDSIWYGTRALGRFVSRPLTVNGNYRVVITDLDGDGRDDALWYGPGAALDYVHYSTGRGSHASVSVTINGDYRPSGGDFDGDGRGDVLWYAPGPGRDYIWYGHGRRGSFASHPMTVNGVYEAVTGDFDGDDRTDIAWLRSSPVGSPLWYGRATRGTFGESTLRRS